MDAKLDANWAMTEQDRSLSDAFKQERSRLRSFIRRRVPDAADADDILQDVFHELIESARLVRPIEQVGAWLFRVARNRITDLFRRQKVRAADMPPAQPGDDMTLDDLLPSLDGGPEAAYARRVLLDELDEALDELPDEQRSGFIAHELDGVSFKTLSEQTGVSVNTLLSRKRYAVLHLRRRLQSIHDDFSEP